MADKIQRSQIVTKVRRLLQDDAFDEDVITDAANWAQDELCNDHRLRFMEESDSLTASQGDTTIDFPDDMQTMINLYLTVPQVYDLLTNYVEYGDFMKMWANFASMSQGQLLQWTDFGNAMRLARPLDASHTIQIDYLRRPDHVVNDSDEFELVTNYEELLSKMSLARVMEVNEDYGEASQERANYAPLLTAFVRNEGRGQLKTGPTIMRTNRGRTGSNRTPGLLRDF